MRKKRKDGEGGGGGKVVTAHKVRKGEGENSMEGKERKGLVEESKTGFENGLKV